MRISKKVKSIRINKYVLIYSERCTPSIKGFPTKKAALDFIKEFHKKYPDALDREAYGDNWIDLLIKGSVTEIFEGYEGWNES